MDHKNHCTHSQKSAPYYIYHSNVTVDQTFENVCRALQRTRVDPCYIRRLTPCRSLCLFNTVCVCLSPHDVRTHPPTPRSPSCPRARSITCSDRGGNGSKVSPRGANGSVFVPCKDHFVPCKETQSLTANGSKVSPRGANASACCPGNLQTECGGPK
jgi:hypothetical protein